MKSAKSAASSASRTINEHAAMGPSPWAQRMLEKQGWNKGKGLGKKEDGMVTHVRVAKKEDNAALGFKEAQSAKDNDQWYLGLGGDPFAAARVGGSAAVRASADSDSDDDDSASDGGEGGSGGGGGSGRSAKRPRAADAPPPADGAAAPQPAAFPGAPQGEDVQLFYQRLFKATGGARLGMRARRDQPGKWDRAEAKRLAAAGAAEAAAGEAAAGEAAAGEAAAGEAAAGEAAAGEAAAASGEEAAAEAKAARKAARRALREEEREREERAARKALKREKRSAEGVPAR